MPGDEAGAPGYESRALRHMRTSDFDYHLPKELIAQSPVEPRDHSRLMVVSRADGSVQHRRFYELTNYLRPGDLLVFNDSRVFPARLYGTLAGTGGKVELLLLHRLSEGVWRAIVRPGRRLRKGVAFNIAGGASGMGGEVLEVEADGTRLLRLNGEELLEDVGVLPLPPYIHEPLRDPERYQTVYARVSGSVAAPTAGLHFTHELLARLHAMGVGTAFVTLHVSWDSFRPVRTEDVSGHKLHSEHFEVDEGTADAVNLAKREGRRVIAVGTTAVRVLEHLAASQGNDGVVVSASGWADLFIYPGHRFRVVDALVTNFHLPRSTLLMLTSAFAGREPLLSAYREAAGMGYRFYSFGDAMLIS